MTAYFFYSIFLVFPNFCNISEFKSLRNCKNSFTRSGLITTEIRLSYCTTKQELQKKTHFKSQKTISQEKKTCQAKCQGKGKDDFSLSRIKPQIKWDCGKLWGKKKLLKDFFLNVKTQTC